MPTNTDRWLFIRQGMLPGALAGLVGGLVFGAAMFRLGVLPTIASLVRADTAGIGFAVHMTIAAVVGTGFGLIAWHQRPAAGEMLFWGLAYGALWWFLGPLTLLPLFLGQQVVWTLDTAQAAFPSLLGHLWYGAITALAYAVLRRAFVLDRTGDTHPHGQSTHRPIWPALLRGGLAGLLAAWLLGLLLDAQGELLAFSSAMMGMHSLPPVWGLLIATGVLAGVGFAALYPQSLDSTGAGLIRGTVYGFAWWVAGALTLLPVLYSGDLAWSLEEARLAFAYLAGFVLFGAGMVLLYRIFTGLVRALFGDIRLDDEQEGIGSRGLQALGRGALAGIVGGLLFTVVMVQIGFLPTVAQLVGGTSSFTGFVVHLIISILIGASYGVLFQRQSYDTGSALGWGVSYGVLWWVLGPLTLLPILLGAPPRWNIATAMATVPSLIGHILYGVGLAWVFFAMEARYNPWWLPRRQTEAERSQRRREQLFTASPAVWVMIIVIALTLSVIVSTQGFVPQGGSYGY